MDVVTVALDTDVEAARPFHEAAQPTHPSLVDPGHVTVGLFGMTNVPFAIWIDEDGTIVRPAELAFAPGRRGRGRGPVRADRAAPGAPAQDHRADDREHARPGPVPDCRARLGRHGRDSRYVLSEAEVIERSRPRPPEFGLAAAHFELAQHLHRAGFSRDAVPHFQEAHRLDPTNGATTARR